MRGGRGGHANTAFSLVSPSKSRDELGRGKGGKALLVFLFFLLLSFCQVFGSEETLIVFFPSFLSPLVLPFRQTLLGPGALYLGRIAARSRDRVLGGSRLGVTGLGYLRWGVLFPDSEVPCLPMYRFLDPFFPLIF